MTEINNGNLTTAMKQVHTPIKKELIRLMRQTLHDAGFNKFPAPASKVVARVTDFYEYGEDDETPTQTLRREMRNHPYVSTSFNDVASAYPDLFTEEVLAEFIETVHNNGFVPEDVTLTLSPYNKSDKGTLCIVLIFDREVYGEETGEIVDARFTVITTEDIETETATPAPVVATPRSPFDLLNS